MSGLPGWPFPEFSLLKVVGQNLLQSDSPTVRRFTLDILNRMPKPVLVCDAQGRPLFQNQAYTALGRGREEAVPAELNPACRELNRILDAGFPVLQFRDEIPTADGGRVPVLLDIYPVTGDGDRRLGALVLATDLTEEQAGRTWREQMSFVLDAVGAGVVVLDPAQNVAVFNRFARQALGMGDMPLTGGPVSRILEVLPPVPGEMLRTLLAQESGSGEVQLRGPDGPCSFQVETSVGPGGRVIVFHDLTMVKETARQIHDFEKLAAIGELAAGTAHEIRNPLTTIRGFVQILQQKAKNAGIEDINRYAEIIINEIDRVNSIIAEFLLLAKPTAVRWQQVDLNQVVEQVFPFVQNEALRLEMGAEKELQESLPPVHGDIEQIKQVLLNLVNNALQALSTGGLVKISTFLAGDGRVCLSVEDNGTGMPSDVMDKIFKPFFSTKENGTGLGLAISKRIMEDHHGEIIVKSKEGVGSTFLLCLPPMA